MAHGVPAPRHCVPPLPDRHAVRHGASAARVTFLHPWALVGLAAAVIPALLHLLERRVPPEAEFPPLRYLSEAERQNARRLKLRHLLLLILRTALIVLIVLAAARPLFPTQASAGSLHEPTALAVILDNSASSGLVVDGRPALERLKAAARGPLARATALALRIRGRGVGRALAAPGTTASITLPPLGPGWWVGDAVLDADELRADDRRLLVWRVAPPARVAALPTAGGSPFVAAALAVLEEGQRVRGGSTDVTIGDRPEAGTLVSVVIPPAEPALIGQ